MAEKLDLNALERANLGKVVRPEDWMAVLAYARGLEAAIKRQANAVRTLRNAEIEEARIRHQLADEAMRATSPELLASEREANAILTAENERLEARIRELEARATARAENTAVISADSAVNSLTPACGCQTCRPITMADMRMVLCPACGNKRCPHGNDHRNACTGSNERGQAGSAYPRV